MRKVEIGVIGGSGLYHIEGLENLEEVKISTPFGEPSDAFLIGKLEGREIAFLSRHGRGHTILPGELNFRANIYGMKMLGVKRIISVSAVGSMKEHIHPGDIVIPDQFYDNTKHRTGTFFGNGIVAHISFADPVCPVLSDILFNSAKTTGATVHKGGVYLCIEGPQFSTRGESLIYRQWGVDVIGMTNVTEAKLAREAEMCYSTIALVTDYDCWHEEEEDVTAEAIIAILKANVERSKKIIKDAINRIPEERNCICAHALKDAIITAPEKISPEMKENIKLIIEKYLN